MPTPNEPAWDAEGRPTSLFEKIVVIGVVTILAPVCIIAALVAFPIFMVLVLGALVVTAGSR